WRQVAYPAGTIHQGSMSATLSTPLPGAQQITAKILSGGQTREGGWEGQFTIEGAARAAQRAFGQAPTTQSSGYWAHDFDWKVRAPTLSWRGSQAFSMQDVFAKLRSHGAEIVL